MRGSTVSLAYMYMCPTVSRRLTSLLQRTRGKVVLGGESDEGSRYISPTVVTDVANDDELMQAS